MPSPAPIARRVPPRLAAIVLVLGMSGWFAWAHGDGAVADPMPDFATLARASSPNSYLVLPPGFASPVAADAESPVYPVPVAVLEEAALAAIRAQPRVVAVAGDPVARQYAFVQRTPVLRFPDTVTVRFVDLGGQSSLALFSRSKYGRSDLGVNRARVEAWLAAIRANLPE